MYTTMFNLCTSRVQIVEAGEKSRYGHTFGGPRQHDGVRIPGCRFNARLHYNFNLDDPKLGFKIPGVKWLPLYWALPDLFPNGEFAYRVLPGSRIEILTKAAKRTLDRPFAEKLPRFPVGLTDHPCDASTPQGAYELAGIFGLDGVKPRQKAAIIRKLKRDHEKNRVLLASAPPVDTLSVDELLYWSHVGLFLHGVPRGPCPNPACRNHDYNSSKERHYRGRSILLFVSQADQDADARFYEECAGAEYGYLTFEICKDCFAVTVSNPCT